MSKETIKFIIFFGLGFFVFYYLFRNIEISDLRIAFRNFNWRFSIFGFGLYVLLNVFRALRFNFFLGGKIGFWLFFKIVLLYNFWNQTLPFRSGELFYIYYLRKTKKVLIGENLASLVGAKVFDLFVVAIFALAGIFFAFKGKALEFNLSIWIVAGAVLIAFIFVLLIFFNKKLAAFFEFFFKKTGLLKFKTVSLLEQKLKEVLETLSGIKSIKRFFVFLGYSASIWLIDAFMIKIMADSAGIEISFWQAVASAAFLVFAIFILPFQTPANVGTYEGALVLAFSLFGFEKNIAVSASILIHLQNILFAFILFIFALVFKKLLNHK